MAPLIMLLIQNDADVQKGVAILQGRERVETGMTVQFAFMKSEVNVEYSDLLNTALAEGKVGDKGNLAITQHLASALSSSTTAIHIRFVYCNLSKAALAVLYDALRNNTALIGFTEFWNPGTDKEVSKRAIIATHAPLQIFNNRPLPAELITARKQRATAEQRAREDAAKQQQAQQEAAKRAAAEQLAREDAAKQEAANERARAEQLAATKQREQELKAHDEAAQQASAAAALASCLASGDTARFGRSRVVLTGMGRVGKTSTAKALLGIPFDANESSTIGVDSSNKVSIESHDATNWNKRIEGNPNEYQHAVVRAAAYAMRHDGPRVKKEGLKVVPSATTQETTENSSNEASNPAPGAATSTSSARRASFSGAMARRMSSAKNLLLGGGSKQQQPSTTQQQLPVATTTPAPPPDEDTLRLLDSKLLSTALAEEDDPNARSIALYIYDLAGQDVFRSLFQWFLTDTGIYAVVTDLCHHLPTTDPIIHAAACKDMIFWLKSIQLHAPKAHIIVIGTHKDQVPAASLAAINEHLEQDIKIQKFGQLLANKLDKLWFFPVDNSKGANGDPVIVRLRTTIIDAVKDSEHVNRALPISWMRMLDEFARLRNTNPYLSKADLMNLCVANGVPPDHVPIMLQTFHELSVVFYASDATDLRDVVVLDPQWLLTRFTDVIRDSKHHKRDLIQDDELHTKFAHEYDELCEHGILAKTLLDYLWSMEKPEMRDFLIGVMKHMHLACDWKDAEDGRQGTLLIPSILDIDPTLCSLPADRNTPLKSIAAVFELDFSKTFIPDGLFARLVTLAVQHSTTQAGSRKAAVSKTKATLSFGKKGDFCMELEGPRVIVSIMHDTEVAHLRKMLASVLDHVKSDTSKELKFVVILRVNDAKISLQQAEMEYGREAREVDFRSEWDDNMVQTADLKIFLEEPPQPTPEPITIDGSHDVYLAHKQTTGGDQTEILHSRLERLGVSAWIDRNADQIKGITGSTMEANIIKSRKVLLFLSKDVFTSSWVLFELRTAIRLEKPILLVHESRANHPGYEDFEVLKRQAPEDLKSLFSNVDSIAFQTLDYLVEGMMKVLVGRIKAEPT